MIKQNNVNHKRHVRVLLRLKISSRHLHISIIFLRLCYVSYVYVTFVTFKLCLLRLRYVSYVYITLRLLRLSYVSYVYVLYVFLNSCLVLMNKILTILAITNVTWTLTAEINSHFCLAFPCIFISLNACFVFLKTKILTIFHSNY